MMEINEHHITTNSTKEEVIAAVKINPYLIQYASEKMRADFEVAAAIFQLDESFFGHSMVETYSNSILRSIESIDPRSLISESLRWDKNFMFQAVRKNGYGLRFSSPEIQANRDIVLAAVKNDGQAFEFASEPLREDREIAIESLKTAKKTWRDLGWFYGKNNDVQIVGKSLFADREFILEAIKVNSQVFAWASIELRSNREIALTVIEQDGYQIRFVSDSLKDDVQIVAKALLSGPVDLIKYASDRIRYNLELLFETEEFKNVSFKDLAEGILKPTEEVTFCHGLGRPAKKDASIYSDETIERLKVDQELRIEFFKNAIRNEVSGGELIRQADGQALTPKELNDLFSGIYDDEDACDLNEDTYYFDLDDVSCDLN